MDTITHAIDGTGTLAEDARAFMAAIAFAAGQKVGQAHECLATTLESAKEMACNARVTAVAGARTADEVVRKHPYPALAISAVAGGLLGFLISRTFRNAD